MPDIEIQMPDGTIATFPEGTSDTVIDAVAKKNAAALKMPQEESLGDFAKGFGSNVIKSGFNTLKGGVEAIEHLPTTVSNLGKVGLGVAEKAFGTPGVPHEHEKYADALGQYYKDRYGGWENIKKTAYNDPVGALLDVAPVVGGAGTALRGVGTVTNLGTLADVGRALETAGSLGTGKVVKAAGEGLKEGGISQMIRALKPRDSTLQGVGTRWGPQSDLAGRARNVAEGLIKEGVNPNAKGVSKLVNRLEKSQNELDDLAATSTAMVDTAPASSNLQAGQQAATWESEASAQRWQDVIDEWNRNPHASSPVQNPVPGGPTRTLDPQIPYATAQKLKRGTYRMIGDAAYGELSSPEIQALKAKAAGLREAQDVAEPAGVALNARTGELIDLRDVLGASAKRVQNLSLLDLPSTVMAAGRHPILTAATLASRPGIASPLARLLYASGRGAEAAAGPMDFLARSALLTRLAEEEKQQSPPNQ